MTEPLRPGEPAVLMVPPADIRSVDLADFRRAVFDLELLDAESFDRFTVEATHDVPTLATLLVRNNHLTGYQAAALLQGKARGLVVGPYLVLSKCGQGGMGVVFKVRHRPTGQVAALKILPPSLVRTRHSSSGSSARSRPPPGWITRTSSGSWTQTRTGESTSWRWNSSRVETSGRS